jgi:ubiquinone/menaquinone biosynthesis C-methylase UbiE
VVRFEGAIHLNVCLSYQYYFSKDIGPNHLEVAVGSGSLFDLVLKWRALKKMPKINVVAFDYAERMLDGARKRFKNNKNVTLLRADVTQLSLDSDQFDSATIANAIHCLPDVKSGLKEIHRVLKKQGQLIGNCLLEPRGNTMWDRFARRINNWGIKKGILNRPFEAREVQDLLIETGFMIDRYEITGNCLNFVASKVDL